MKRGPATEEPPPRTCRCCSAPLVRKPNEAMEKWRKRVCCNSLCANRTRKRGATTADIIHWDPIVADHSTDHQCWAGFMANRRCTKPRDGHAVHVDANGMEFTKLGPTSKPGTFSAWSKPSWIG